MKIENDKYYTPIEIANHCIDKVLEIIGEENISEVIEPSVGGGSFLHHPKMMIHFAYDIAPECSSDTTVITTGDYLEQKIDYLWGRLVIGNPPYVWETRKSGTAYEVEMDNDAHQRFVDRLLQCKCKLLISGYDHPIYDKLLTKFNKVSFPSPNSMSESTETLWMNYTPIKDAKENSLW